MSSEWTERGILQIKRRFGVPTTVGMMQDEYRRRGSIEGSNVPGNPLRSYRMSMLAHGFVDADGSRDFSLDDSDAVSYSVVRIRRNPRWGFAIPAVALILALVAGILVAA